MKKIIWIALAWLALGCPAYAASFDCVKAQTAVEKMICADAELSKLDEELVAAYTNMLKGSGMAASVQWAQKQWLTKRNDCAATTCIKDAYVERLAGLPKQKAFEYRLSDESESTAIPNIAVCQDFMENLKRLGNPPMVCDRKFHPSMKQFKWPRWKSIDAIKHRDLVEQIWQNEYGWAHDEHLRISFETRVRNGEIALAVTQIPIDGELTMVLRFIKGDKGNPCKPEDWDSTYPLRQYFVVDPKLQRLNLGVTYKSVLNGYFSYSKEMRPDLFLHNGKPYIAFWDMQGAGKGVIEIFGDHRNFCHINFTSKTEGRQP